MNEWMNVGLSPFHQQNLDRSAGVPLSWVWITGGVRKSQSTKTAPAHQKNPTQYTCPHARSLRDNGLHDDKKVDHRNHLRNALSSSNACQGRSSVCLFVCLWRSDTHIINRHQRALPRQSLFIVATRGRDESVRPAFRVRWRRISADFLTRVSMQRCCLTVCPSVRRPVPVYCV